jgi:hypothetical protein
VWEKTTGVVLLVTFRTLEVGNLNLNLKSGNLSGTISQELIKPIKPMDRERELFLRPLLEGGDYYVPFEQAMRSMPDHYKFKKMELGNLLPTVSTQIKKTTKKNYIYIYIKNILKINK